VSTVLLKQVIPGASNKLLFYFQGGGACWDAYSTKSVLCTTDVSPQSLVGVFSRTNANTRFRDYTVVHILYCSGDSHQGNVTRPYNDEQGQPVVQRGLVNAQSALDWVQQQVVKGSLATKFSELIVMGCSAGSIGAQVWARKVLATLPHSTAAVVPDSYAGDFPPGTSGPLIYGFGFCTSGLLSAALEAKCNAQMLTLSDIALFNMQATPSIPYVFLQSKVDNVQQSFYDVVALTSNSSQKSITPTQFYSDVNDIFGGYNSQQANFVAYLIDGDHHCFTDQELYYTADPQSSTDNGVHSDNLMMHEYLNTLPLQNALQISSVCEGTVAEKFIKETDDNMYCSSQVVPKTFVEKY
jgi:hypothetical protein